MFGEADRGAALTEYAAVLLLVATTAVAVLMASVPEGIADLVRWSMCRVESTFDEGRECSFPGETNPSDPSDPSQAGYDFNPEYCVRDGRKETVGGKIDIGVISFGSEYHYAKETLSDGTVVVTMLPEMEAGWESGAGGGVDFGKDSLKQKPGGGIKATLAPGTTFFLDGEKPGETGEEEFQRLKDDIEQARREEQEDMWGGDQGFAIGRAIGEVTGHYEPPDLPDPDIKSATVGLKGNADGPIRRWAEKSDSQMIQDGDKIGLTSGDDWNVEVAGKVDTARWYDEPDNIKTAHTYTFTGSGDMGAKAVGQLASGGLDWTGATRIMRNEDGSLKNIRYTTIASGKFKGAVEGTRNDKTGKAASTRSRSVTQEVQIDFETPEEQEIGERLLEQRGLLPPTNVMDSMVNPLLDAQEGGTITQKPDEDAEPWDHLFHKRGRVWQYQADSHTEAYEFGAKAKLGLSFGASFGWSAEDLRTTDAQILEGPQGEDGERRFVDHEPCVAPEHRGDN